MAAQANSYQCAFCPFRSQELDVVQRHANTCTGVQSPPPDDPRGTPEDSGNSLQPQENAWSHEAIKLLIDSYRLHEPEFSDNCKKKKKYQVWRDISSELQSKGHAFDGAACDQKMRTLKRRYKTIKDNATLSGRRAVKQWPYFLAMDELLAGDPSITPIAVQSCFSNGSPSSSQVRSKPSAAGVSEPAVCTTPSPTPSPSTPVRSPSPSYGDPKNPPQPKRRRVVDSPYTEAVHQQGKLLENLVSQNQERRGMVEQLITRLSTPSSTPSEEKQELQKKIDELHQRLLKQQEDHHRENREIQQYHNKETKELHLRYQNEIKEMQQKFMDMQQQHQKQLIELMFQMNKKS